ncbi:sugar kinase [Leifsonia naganoensis]|uniref:2-dehydro-3-deoxygluconokinase n=1 Tax=Leifsonia naganoensis TaxID=150025 RepID=A0A853DUC8_9MICO|nr:sugar kinase [Leifsonia naganoensis]NYK09700.1 2-dehydro-3-deoxygluconokinase [Leifsonia naganoensis]
MPSPLLVTLGEAMVVLYPEAHRPLAEATAFGSDVGGAEFNVATSLARLGLPTAWISRLGADGFGERILRVAADAGLDTRAVELDEQRPTGLYVKESTPGADGVATRMHYYRRDSAASALGLEQLHAAPAAALLRRASHLHTSGITAALSPSAAEVTAGLREVVGPETLISVDLNFRPRLWHDRDTAPLDALVAQADLLFAGHDEAQAHFGHTEPARLFAAYPHLDAVVLKEDAHRASVHRRDGHATHVPCLTVEVVEPVGAGDAFAAGFLAGLAEGRDDAASLRLGHALAALTLIGHGDRPLTVPTAAERETIAAAGDEWAGWRVHPGEIPWRSA